MSNSTGMMIDLETYARLKELLKSPEYIMYPAPFEYRAEPESRHRYHVLVKEWVEWKSEDEREWWIEQLEKQK